MWPCACSNPFSCHASIRLCTWLTHLEVIIIRDVWNTDDEHAHLAFGTVDDTGRDVNQRAFVNRLLFAIEDDGAAAFEDVIQLGGALVVMKLRSVDVHGMGPGSWMKFDIFATDEAIPPAAGAALAGCVTFVPDQR